MKEILFRKERNAENGTKTNKCYIFVNSQIRGFELYDQGIACNSVNFGIQRIYFQFEISSVCKPAAKSR